MVNSLVEINAAILVACMPACAAYYRHLQTYLRSQAARIFRRKGMRNSSIPPESEVCKETPEMQRPEKARYWRLTNWIFGQDEPPHITSVKTLSRPDYVHSVYRQGTLLDDATDIEKSPVGQEGCGFSRDDAGCQRDKFV